jgi:hypothetical protein
LSYKAVDNAFDGIQLELLVLEFNLHLSHLPYNT